MTQIDIYSYTDILKPLVCFRIMYIMLNKVYPKVVFIALAMLMHTHVMASWMRIKFIR